MFTEDPDFEKLIYDPSLEQLKIVFNSAIITKKLHIQLFYPNVDILERIQKILKNLAISSSIFTKNSKFIFLSQESVIKMRELDLFTDKIENKFQKILSRRYDLKVYLILIGWTILIFSLLQYLWLIHCLIKKKKHS